MTSQQIYQEVLASLGNRTDLAQVANIPRIVRWMNWAVLEVCGMHRKKIITPKRFHALEGFTFFSTFIETGQAQSGSSNTIQLKFASIKTDYVDCVVEITGYIGTAPAGLIGQLRIVQAYAAGTQVAVVTENWDTNPDANTLYTVYQRRYSVGNDIPVDPVDNMWAIELIEDVDTGLPVEQKDWEEVAGTQYVKLGTPAAFARYGNEIIFDQTPNSSIYYRVYYYKSPTLMTVTGVQGGLEVPIIPSSWHEAIVDGAVYRGFRKLMEPDRASEARQTFVDSVVNRKTDIQFEEKQKVKGLRVRIS